MDLTALKAKRAKVSLDIIESRFDAPQASLEAFEAGSRLAAKVCELVAMSRRLSTMLRRVTAMLRQTGSQYVAHTQDFLRRRIVHCWRVSSICVDSPSL